MKRLLKLLIPDIIPMLNDELMREKFSIEDRRRLIQQALLGDAKYYIDSLHMMLCNSDTCDYEPEESIEHTWTLPAHIEWTNIAAVVMDVIGFELSEWPALANDYIKMLEILNRSKYGEKLLLRIHKDPSVFLDEIRSIIAKNDPLEL